MTTAIYLRVSTETQQQEGASLPAQEALCRAECERRGATSITVYQDAQSAKDTNRPALQRLLQDVAARRYRLCVIYDLTRLSRDLLDAISLMKLFHAGGCEVTFLNDPVDQSTPFGQLLFHLKGALAEFERRQIGQRVRVTKERMVADGKRANGAIPYGYMAGSGTDLIPHPERAEACRLLFRLYADEGLGTVAIARELTRRSIPPPGRAPVWSQQTVTSILRAPCHQGMQRSGRAVGPWPWARVVPPDLAARAHKRDAAERRRYGPRTITHAWSGLLRCGECGSPLEACRITAGHGRQGHILYYRCAHRVYARQGRPIPPCAARMLRQDAMEPVEAWIRKTLTRCKPRARRKREETDAASELERIEEQRRRVTVAYTTPGSLMTDAEYRAALADCDARARAVSPPEPAMPGGTPKGLGETWERLTLTERHAALSLLVRAVVVYPTSITVHLVLHPWAGWPVEKAFPRPAAKGRGFMRRTMGNDSP